MSQVSGRPCPACRTMVPTGQRFCSNCGTDMTVSGQASQYGGPPPQSFPQQSAQQVPPYAQAPGSFGLQQQPQQKSNPIAEALGALGLLFFLRRYRPGYVARRQSSGCCGCLVALVILLAIFGTPAYFYYRANPNFLNQIKNAANNDTNSGGVPTTQPPITATASINQSVTYAGVNISIASVQQSTAFIDDDQSAANGMVRVNIKEANNGGNAGYAYSEVAHLVLPDQSSVALTNAQQISAPANGIIRPNWLDFAVPTSDKIVQLTLVLGTAQEAQVIIPLTGKADLKAYQAVTSSPNTSTQYAGLTWTVTSATASLSFNGQQAQKGMLFVTVTMKVDNPTTTDFNAYWGDYIRLKAGDTTASPTTDTTLPLSFAPGTSGSTGNVIFIVPQGSSGYTLMFLNTPGTNFTAASVNFQI